MEEIQDELFIDVDFSDPGDHESAAERNNRTIQEWFRTAIHRLPHRVMP